MGFAVGLPFTGQTKDGGYANLYIKKTITGANDLKKLVEDGKGHQVIVEITLKKVCHPSYPDCSFLPTEIFYITKFIQEGWAKE